MSITTTTTTTTTTAATTTTTIGTRAIIEQQMPRVNKFLQSTLRGSKNTYNLYKTALAHFQDFLSISNSKFNLETMIEPIKLNNLDVYELLDGFVSYLLSVKQSKDSTKKLGMRAIRVYITGVKAYLEQYDIEISPKKLKRKVRIPKVVEERQEPIDDKDIRKILLACSNRRLKAYLLILASSALRAEECLSIRWKDINDTISPTKIHIRGEYTKTKRTRDVYISDEATKSLQDWRNFKYRVREDKRKKSRIFNVEDLVFSVYKKKEDVADTDRFTNMYNKIDKEFKKLLTVVGLGELKEGMLRGKITLHSFRRFVKTVISVATNTDYSEWFIGHKGSTYYNQKEPERRQLYAEKCMKYLTFLDYTALESEGKSVDARLSEKDKQMRSMQEQIDSMEHHQRLLQRSLLEALNKIEPGRNHSVDLVSKGVMNDRRVTDQMTDGILISKSVTKAEARQRLKEYIAKRSSDRREELS